MTSTPRTDPVLADPTRERLVSIRDIAAYEPPFDDPTYYRPWTLQGTEGEQ